MTISNLISNIGGFFSLLVMLINYIIFKYQFFRYETSIMKRVYHQDKSLKSRKMTIKSNVLETSIKKKDDQNDDKMKNTTVQDKEDEEILDKTQDENQQEIEQLFDNIEPYKIGIIEWFIFRLNFLLCCCKKYKMKMLRLQKRYETAQGKLSYDLDILEMIKNNSQMRYITSQIFKRYQRQLIYYMRRFNVDN